MLENSSALITSGPTMLTPSVCPSGAALATAAVPVLPLAPARFSTIKGCFSLSCRPSATMRARLSGVEPALKGTMMVTWPDGHSCAWTCVDRHQSPAATRLAMKRRIELLPFVSSQRRIMRNARVGAKPGRI